MEKTINYRGLELEVEFDYQPEEPEVRYYPDGSGYPGSAEEITVSKVSLNGTDITELFDNFTELEEEISQQMEE